MARPSVRSCPARVIAAMLATGVLAHESSARAQMQPISEPPAPVEAAPVHPRALVDVDATFLNIGVGAAGYVGRGTYVGLGFSGLPAISLNTLDRYPVELLEAHAFVRYAPVDLVAFDVGAKLAYFEELYICIITCGSPPSGALAGPYVDLRVGWRRVKFGPRVEYGFRFDDHDRGWLLYPLLMRVEFAP